MRALLALPVLVAALGVTVGAGASGGGCRWRVLLDRPGPQLSAVTAVSDDDVWAVGATLGRGTILRWDGRAWLATAAAILPLDVDAFSARDAWIVGSSSPAALLSRAETEHWDGARWKAVSVPAPLGSYLRGVSVLSSGVWAVGAGVRGPLVVRWTGRAWRSSPVGPTNGLLHAVDDGWAAGTQGQSSATGSGSEDPLVERLAGGRWRIVRTPSLESVDENLLDLDAVSAGDVWAVGSSDLLGGRAPLVQRLEGRVWRDESVAGLPESQAALLAVAAFGQNDAWAAGTRGFSPQRTLLAHWDGSRWTQAPSRAGSLSDLSALSPHDIWAVGGSAGRSLVERFSC